MALEKKQMTQALFDELAREGIELKQTEASSAKQAIANVFPRRAAGQVNGHTMVGLAPGSTPAHRRLH